jgi:hypothetical protein
MMELEANETFTIGMLLFVFINAIFIVELYTRWVRMRFSQTA